MWCLKTDIPIDIGFRWIFYSSNVFYWLWGVSVNPLYRLSVCIDIGFKIVSSGVRTWVPVAGVLYTCRFERSSSQLPSTQVPSLYSTYVYKFLVMRPDGRYMYLIFTIFHKRKICGFKMRFCSFAVLFTVLKTAQNRTLKNCGFICGFKNRTKPHAKKFAVLFAVWKPHAEKFAVLNAVPITTRCEGGCGDRLYSLYW